MTEPTCKVVIIDGVKYAVPLNWTPQHIRNETVLTDEERAIIEAHRASKKPKSLFQQVVDIINNVKGIKCSSAGLIGSSDTPTDVIHAFNKILCAIKQHDEMERAK